jgi:hypothetical protein
VHLGLCVVSNRDWSPHFGTSLVGLVATIPSLKGKVKSFRFMPRLQASMLPKARRWTLREAIEAGCTHALCIDDDMVFPVESLALMMRHDKPFVAANYQGKSGLNTAITM